MSYHICYVTSEGCAGINVQASSIAEAALEALKLNRFEEKDILYIAPQSASLVCQKN